MFNIESYPDLLTQCMVMVALRISPLHGAGGRDIRHRGMHVRPQSTYAGYHRRELPHHGGERTD